MNELSARQWKYLDIAALDSMRGFEFVTRRIVEGYFSGRHRSPHRDFAQEFTDYRPYSPGDDLRMLDWKAYARSDRFFVKLFRQDTGMSCHIFIDASNSMLYRGEPSMHWSKLEYGCHLAACLSFVILKQTDRVGLCVFDARVRDFIPAAGGMSRLFTILERLERIIPRGRTSIAESMRLALPMLSRRGVVVVISDFLDEPDDIFSALSLYTHRGFEVLLLQVLHPDELRLPDISHARFRDMEGWGQVELETDVLRRAYEEEIQSFMQELRRQALARRIDYELAVTDTPPRQVLHSRLVRRGARRG